MTKCERCEMRKGKRVCPVVGPLCSQCCGEHRLRDIAYPETCAYLLDAGRTLDQAFKNASRKLLEYTLQIRQERLRPAVDALLGPDRKMHDWESDCFLAYLAYGCRDEKGDRSVDLYLREHAHELAPAERQALRCLDDAWVSVFVVGNVVPDVGIQLIDALTEEAVFVREHPRFPDPP